VSPLRGTDARRLLEFVGDAHGAEGPEPFTTELLDELAGVMQAGFASYYAYDVVRDAAVIEVPCSRERLYPTLSRGERARSRLSRLPGAHPFSRPAVGAWSDHVDRASRLRFETTPWAGRFEIVDCLGSFFRLSPSVCAAVALHAQDRDFGTRDRERMLALRPHFAALIRSRRAQRQLTTLTSTLDALDDAEPRGFVVLGPGLRIEDASPPARRMLRDWFGGLDGRLPPLVEDWLLSSDRADPLQVEADGKRLLVEAPTAGALLLTEETALPQPLTPRELEVLRGLAAGKSTAEIARDLWVMPATVSKHLEHIYRKLGVTSRTAALAAVGVRFDSREG
jgi:DNA-binding CsgD family transcriptional regulator